MLDAKQVPPALRSELLDQWLELAATKLEKAAAGHPINPLYEHGDALSSIAASLLVIAHQFRLPTPEGPEPFPDRTRRGIKSVMRLHQIALANEDIDDDLLELMATQVEHVVRGDAAISGICASCGCTDEDPCEGGCSWDDDAQTRCTACVVDLVETGGAS